MAKGRKKGKAVAARVAARHRVEDGKGFRLARHDPGDSGGLTKDDRDAAEARLEEEAEAIGNLQAKLYAQDRWSLLLVFQALDAAGKDSTIKRVLSGVDPQGSHVTAFKAPSAGELEHDFLWRTTLALPERGRIGVFNRSYYEEVLVVRVEPKILAGQKLPPALVTKNLWRERFESINAFERHLARNGTAIVKFFLHVSREEQRKRFLERLEEPAKNWKFSVDDIAKGKLFDDYQHAYEDAIRNTAAPHAPWYVVPADRKWYSRLVVAEAIRDALESLKPEFPTLSAEKQRELATVRKALRAQTTPKLPIRKR
ncbi:MAG TPA: polyphosphate kinase 2 family protein [Candidatus Saccharimonadia bacterium]|nr:polyphosphate kinase 2 family protein [Candidatus Saccharimonadia bacterium]